MKKFLDEQVGIRGDVAIEPTSLKKFKDVESLKKAYDSLEAEFTKRCQRLKELEGELAELKRAKTNGITDTDAVGESGNNADTGADENFSSYEKCGDGKPSFAKDTGECGKVYSDENAEFLAKHPLAVDMLDEISALIAIKKDGGEEFSLRDAYTFLLEKKVSDTDKPITASEAGLWELINSTDLKKRIIREYLGEVRRVPTGVKLMCGAGEPVLAPPVRPKTIAEAGALAQNIIQNKYF